MNEIEQRARTYGWVPLEEYRNKDKWVDAETFLDRTEAMTPILKANNRKLEADIAKLAEENRKLASLYGASQESIVELQSFHESNLKEALARQKRELGDRLAAAREEGDTHAEVEIQAEIAELAQRKVEKPAPPVATPIAPVPQANPDFEAWKAQNPWFGIDQRKTQMAMGIANLIEADPANVGISSAEFFQRVSDELAARTSPGGGHSKVGSGRATGDGGGGGGGSRGGTDYSSLPAEAQDACNVQARKLVGEGRAFKDLASWQGYYAKTYFAAEEKANQRKGY